MVSRISLFAVLLPFAASGCGAPQQADSQFNDIATGVRLMDEHPLNRATAAEKTTRLAECSGTLSTAARQTPPPPRAQRMEELASRLLRLAHARNDGGASPRIDVARVRDDTIAANLSLVARRPEQFGPLLNQSAEACGIADAMTDQELAG